MLEEFKKFALRGNVVDLAIGVIIGAAFGAIVPSLVGDIIMPVVGAVTGGLDFSNYFIPLSPKVTAATLVEAKKQGAVLAWGNFLTIALNFIIIAFVLFLAIRAIGRLMAKEAEKAPALSKQEQLLTEIRDLLKSALNVYKERHGRKTRAPLQGGRRQPQGALQLRDRRDFRGRHRAHRQRGEIAARRQGDHRRILCRCARRRDLADQRQYPGISAGGRFNHLPKRPRKLLLHQRQINKLAGAVEREGMTIVPLKLYFNEKGRAKIEIALARARSCTTSARPRRSAPGSASAAG